MPTRGDHLPAGRHPGSPLVQELQSLPGPPAAALGPQSPALACLPASRACHWHCHALLLWTFESAGLWRSWLTAQTCSGPQARRPWRRHLLTFVRQQPRFAPARVSKMVAAAFSLSAAPLAAGRVQSRPCRARRAACTVRAAAAASEMVPDMDKRVRAPRRARMPASARRRSSRGVRQWVLSGLGTRFALATQLRSLPAAGSYPGASAAGRCVAARPGSTGARGACVSGRSCAEAPGCCSRRARPVCCAVAQAESAAMISQHSRSALCGWISGTSFAGRAVTARVSAYACAMCMRAHKDS